jgi:hypothetical protein
MRFYRAEDVSKGLSQLKISPDVYRIIPLRMQFVAMLLFPRGKVTESLAVLAA